MCHGCDVENPDKHISHGISSGISPALLLNLCISPLIRSRCFRSAANGFSGLVVHEKIHLIDYYLLKVYSVCKSQNNDEKMILISP